MKKTIVYELSKEEADRLKVHLRSREYEIEEVGGEDDFPKYTIRRRKDLALGSLEFSSHSRARLRIFREDSPLVSEVEEFETNQ